MLTLRKAEDRGHSDLGWLTSYHTFSFGGYHDPKHMGFRALRVLNDDRVAAGKGFGAHGHRDMEILSYVLDGRLAHKDSMGEAARARPERGAGDERRLRRDSQRVQRISDVEPTHFLQIWLVPAVDGIKPSYQQFAYRPSEKRGALRLIAGPEKTTNPPSAFINQDARMYAAVLGAARRSTIRLHRAARLGAGRGRRDRSEWRGAQGRRRSRGQRRVLADASRRRRARWRTVALRSGLSRSRGRHQRARRLLLALRRDREARARSGPRCDSGRCQHPIAPCRRSRRRSDDRGRRSRGRRTWTG